MAPDFFTLLDITVINIYIMYLDRCKHGPNLVRSLMTHLQFKNALYEALLVGCVQYTEIRNETLTHHHSIYIPSHSTKKKLCIMHETCTLHSYYY